MSVEEILKIINELPPQDQKLITQSIIEQDTISKQSDIYNIREEIHESNPIQCPYCKNRNWIRFGFYRGLQKYFCSECNRTFTSLTGSSAH